MNIFQIIFILSHAFITSIVKKKNLGCVYKVIILFNGSLQILIDILINEWIFYFRGVHKRNRLITFPTDHWLALLSTCYWLRVHARSSKNSEGTAGPTGSPNKTLCLLETLTNTLWSHRAGVALILDILMLFVYSSLHINNAKAYTSKTI